MDNISVLQIIYVSGVFASLIIGIIDLFVNMSKDDTEKCQIGMLAPMMLLSWITVFAYTYGKINHKT